ncbi:MAG: ABC transporter permease [Eubacteriales bacterium]|nr:ABC transporter permease [Eubacteriales bacterium]
MSGDWIVSLLAGMVRIAIPIAFAALAGMLCERAGVINMGLEGMMLMGAFFSCVGSYYSGSAWVGLLVGMLAGLCLGLLHATLTVLFKCEHLLSGVGINILADGLSIVLLQIIWHTKGKSTIVDGLGKVSIPVIDRIPVLKEIFGTVSPLFPILLVTVVIFQFVIYHTSFGLRVRVIGDNPEMAGSMGINVYWMQFICVGLSGVLAAVGGAYLSIGDINMFSKSMVAGRGYIALAMVILGGWTPVGVAAAGLVYGFAQSLQIRLQGLEGVAIPAQLVQMLPYVITILVLFIAPRKNRAPAAEGVHYYRKGE